MLTTSRVWKPWGTRARRPTGLNQSGMPGIPGEQRLKHLVAQCVYGTLFLLLVGASVDAAEAVGPLLSALIRVNTSNPPGGEITAARVLARWLGSRGIAAQVLESSPGRGNVVARVAGKRRGRPIILLSHLDVVPADANAWQQPPFGGRIVDGYVHGRGALDAKGLTAMHAGVLAQLAAAGARLDRDLLLVATADEETGGAAGAGWLVREHPELVEGAEFLLTEGDSIHRGATGDVLVQVAIAEKTPCWVELTARGNGGHGSTPSRETAVTRLIDAVARVQRYEAPVVVTPAVASYFAALAPLRPEPLRARLAQLASSLTDPAFREEFTSNPRQNALVRNTVTPTVLAGSGKTNVIPAIARAELDCRLLPGESPTTFLETIRQLVADDQVEIRPMLSFPASASPDDSLVVRAIRTLAAREFPDAAVIPSVIPGFTDSHYFRGLGIASYGFVPIVLEEADERTVHGVNERVSVQNLHDGVERLVALLRLIDDPAPN